MSAGNLQEMETTNAKQSKTAVNANAAPADPMQSGAGFVAATPGQSITDLGGPTPQNYRSTDDSSKLVTGNVATVRDVVNARAARAEEAEYEENEEIVEETEEEETEEEEIAAEEGADEEVVEEDLEFDVQEDIQALFGDEDLSEEFKERAALVFESALRTKVAEAVQIIEQRYEAALEENVAAIEAQLTERVDAYLEYAAGEWLEENALQVETGIKAQLSESFMTGLRGLFEEHYVSIPEEKYDVLESMVSKLDDMESRLNEQIERNIQLNQRLSESVSDGILYDVSRGLAETQKSKLASLAESVEFVSEEDYREKLEALRESYFPRNPVTPEREDEMLGTESELVSESMSAYIKAVSRFSK
ncbi:scaffold prohead core protein [Synechococcus phage DSL-LC03]|nr:scaffold prohead core protein [Synechococcus phage DSL-LC03]